MKTLVEIDIINQKDLNNLIHYLSENSLKLKNIEEILVNSCRNGWTDAVEELLEASVDVDCEFSINAQEKLHGFYTTPLITACENGHIDIVKILLEAGADVDACDNCRRSALVHALKNGHDDIVNLLLKFF